MTSRKSPEPALSAEDLAAQARAGSSASFDALVVRLRPRLVAFLARRLPSAADAEDVAQETFVRAHEHLDRYDPSRPFATWLFTIGKNVAANHVLAGARRAAHEHASAAEPAVDAREASDVWQRAAKILRPDVYRMLWLRYAQSLSVHEIATEMNRSSVAIKVMLFRARRRLLEEVR
jgi:RNA polymerase sigma-70 factor, ECF subfamily